MKKNPDHKPATAHEFFRSAGGFPTSVLAFSGAKPAAETSQEVARRLVGGLPGGADRVARLAKQFDRLQALLADASDDMTDG